MRVLIAKNLLFSECERVREVVRDFEGLIVLCGDLSQCYEVLEDLRGRSVVGTPSVYSDVAEVKMLKELGALCMGRWISVDGMAVGCIDALNPSQSIDMLKERISDTKTRMLVSTQRLRYLNRVGWPSAEELCREMGLRVVIECSGVDGVEVHDLGICLLVEVGCRLAVVEVGVEGIEAKCLNI